MKNNESARVRWVQENLDAIHSKLLPEEAHSWEILYREDVEQFFRCAIFGYMTKHHYYDDARLKLPDAELKEFVAEFCEKIRRASSGVRTRIGLPLFDIVGREKMFDTPELCKILSIRGAK
jgi:hypothetical protein